MRSAGIAAAAFLSACSTAPPHYAGTGDPTPGDTAVERSIAVTREEGDQVREEAVRLSQRDGVQAGPMHVRDPSPRVSAPAEKRVTKQTAEVTADEPELIGGAWKLMYPASSRRGARLERWVGKVIPEAGMVVPDITVRLYDDRAIGTEVGSAIYRTDDGACVYSLRLKEIREATITVDQTSQIPGCAEKGAISFTTRGNVMLGEWQYSDGTTWFSTRLSK